MGPLAQLLSQLAWHSEAGWYARAQGQIEPEREGSPNSTTAQKQCDRPPVWAGPGV